MIFSENPVSTFPDHAACGFGMNERKNGLTYADSGVDIDAGNRLVDLIKPLVRATASPCSSWTTSPAASSSPRLRPRSSQASLEAAANRAAP